MGWLDRLRGRATAPDPMGVALAAAQRGDYAAALAVWEPLARAGVARAQNNIGACFVDGLGVAADPALALRWLSAAAEGGDPVGQRNCAALLLRGAAGVPVDEARAVALYRQAAAQGDGPAQDMLSWMLLEGEPTPAALEEGRKLAEAAAAQGIAAAMTRLGLLYHHARGVARDTAVAARWWRAAAERGDADGQAMLGAALHLGAGVPRDDEAALLWLLRAERGGSALALPFLPVARGAVPAGRLAAIAEAAAQPLPEFEP